MYNQNKRFSADRRCSMMSHCVQYFDSFALLLFEKIVRTYIYLLEFLVFVSCFTTNSVPLLSIFNSGISCFRI